LVPYQPLIDAGFIRRFYLAEMAELANAPLGFSILNLIQQTEEKAPAIARELIVRTKSETGDETLKANLIELIETVIVYKLPRLTREEIQIMLQVHDIRETRVYQEGVEEGAAKVIAKLAKKMSAEEIAAILELDVEQVRKVLASSDRN
jgi:predicted transposase YdaD